MHVGVCRLTLHLYENNSLKGKRRVVHSLAERLRNKFAVAVAEVDTQDVWQTATVGISAVSGDLKTLNSLLDRVIEFAQENVPEADITATEVGVFDY
ncbi:MAG: DUF503 domain-containing protein [Dehalococcoidia bacterium]